MKLMELLHGVEYTAITAPADTEITGIYLDSREVRGGGLFAAVPGFNIDRTAFVPSAMAGGAVCVLAEREVDAPCVVVRDARRALSTMAANFYGNPTSSMTVVGITGTKGKTTTSFLVKQMLERLRGAPVGLIGTNGVYLGDEYRPSERTTPESVELHAIFREMLNKGIDHVVMEVSSHALSLDRVADVRFAVGVYTNLSQDHLDFYGDMDSYFAAKLQLFCMCERAAVNVGDARGGEVLRGAKCPVLTFGSTASADLMAKNIELLPRGVAFTACHKGDAADTSLAIPGMFSVDNALAALAVTLTLGASLDRAADALSHCDGVIGRCEVVAVPADYSVIIDYAHTPDSLNKILQALRPSCNGRLLCLFGCGGDRDRTKRPLMGAVVQRAADIAVVTSDNPRTERPDDIIADILRGMERGDAVTVIPDRRVAIRTALQMARSGDTVLLAGKGQETYQEIHGVKHHMDEREIVAQYFADGEGR